MIYESGIWKLELKKEIETLKNFLSETNLNYDEEFEEGGDPKAEERDMIEVAFLKLQKFAIYTSIIVRKLIEANKISDELLSCNFPIIEYSKSDNVEVTIMNRYEIEKLYLLDKPIKANISIKRMTHLLIHSFHFIPNWNWVRLENELPDDDPENWEVDGLLGIYFSSDETKDDFLSYIELGTYMKALDCVTKDLIRQIEIRSGRVVKKSINVFFNPESN